MSHKSGLAVLLAGLLISGCASTRGGQDIVCERFDDFALAPKPNRFVQDIQRYSAEYRGAGGTGASETAFAQGLDRAERLGGAGSNPEGAVEAQPDVDQLIEQAAFGSNEQALRQEGARLQQAYERERTSRSNDAATPLRGQRGQMEGENEIIVRSTLPSHNVLLLSGGGQWGAYGAGLFLGLACTQDLRPDDDRNVIPCMAADAQGHRTITAPLIDFSRIDAMNIGMITGVSTGGLQSLLLMAVLDKSQSKAGRIAALQQLLDSYAPLRERDLVDHDGFKAVIFQGSVAGTSPLRDHVRRVLNKTFPFRDPVYGSGADNSEQIVGYRESRRRLIDQIGESPITTLVGVVEGTDGRFKYVNMRRMVRELQSEEKPLEEVTDCVLATTLASSAMPVFHQQLRVIKADGGDPDTAPDPLTLFDGGVRRSVFISEIGDAFKRRYFALTGSMSADAYRAALRSDTLPKLYVLRNGPTTSKRGERIDEVDSAITQAMRAYSLLVNELEVGSIAALRLANPYGPIDISTADGAEEGEANSNGPSGVPRRACVKQDEMFNPDFMRCLQNFGARRAMGAELDGNTPAKPIPAFWRLSEIDARPALTVPKPANDD